MKKRVKSQRRRVHDAGTPSVRLGGNYYNPTLEFTVCPIGRPDMAVVFELENWQVAQMVREAAARMEDAAKRFDSMARSWREALS